MSPDSCGISVEGEKVALVRSRLGLARMHMLAQEALLDDDHTSSEVLNEHNSHWRARTESLLVAGKVYNNDADK